MSTLSRRWHAGSIFGTGPRRALDRNQRARFRFLLTAHRRARHITPLAELVGNALVKRLSVDGQCDPAHDTIAADVGCHVRTVRRALDAMRTLGLVIWQRRLVRDGWRVQQSSNAYVLVPLATVEIRGIRTGGQVGRVTRKRELSTADQAPLMVSPEDRIAARAALARIAAQRQGVIEERLLTKGNCGRVRAN